MVVARLVPVFFIDTHQVFAQETAYFLNLTLKVEGRYDRYTQQSGSQGSRNFGAPSGVFFANNGNIKDRDQYLLLAQAMYRF